MRLQVEDNFDRIYGHSPQFLLHFCFISFLIQFFGKIVFFKKWRLKLSFSGFYETLECVFFFSWNNLMYQEEVKMGLDVFLRKDKKKVKNKIR